jgi:hypothetical protein
MTPHPSKHEADRWEQLDKEIKASRLDAEGGSDEKDTNTI